jgi:predicted nucleotidyltransferase
MGRICSSITGLRRCEARRQRDRLDQIANLAYIADMDKDQVIAIIRKHEDELRAAGAEHVSLFGSVARGEATAESDLDVAVTFAEPVIQSGFGYFSAVEDLRRLLTRITGAPSIDIVPEPLSKERFRRNVERDRAVAY